MATVADRPRTRLAAARTRPKRRGLTASRLLVLLLAFVGSAAAGHVVYQRYVPVTAQAAPATTTTVRQGTITALINVSGSTAAISQAKLSFEASGRLVELLVKAGSNVKEGDVLARVDSADLEIQLAQAEVSLEQAKLKLDQLKEGPKEVEVAAAQANYDSAVTKYDDLKAGPTADEVTTAKSAIRDAEVSLANAQNNLVITQKGNTVSKNVRDRENEHNFYEARYGETLDKFKLGQASQADVDRDWSNLLTAKERLDSARVEADLALRRAENDVVKAEESLKKAQTNLETLLTGATPEQLKAAEATMLSAQSQLETKKAGVSATDIAAQEVSVRLAEATLKQRQLLLQKATLRAPFDGVVDAVNANVGEQVSTGKEIITLINMQKFRVDARVSEADVARLAVGQTAAITLDSLPNERLTAKVTFIAASAVSQQGVVNYPLVLELDPTEAKVRPGMTTTAAVEVTRRENVLLVPNRAVRTQGRNRIVEVMVDGQPQTRTVSVGLSDDSFTEVTNGLQEGDLVVIPSTTTTTPRVNQTGGFGIPAVGGMPGGQFIGR